MSYYLCSNILRYLTISCPNRGEAGEIKTTEVGDVLRCYLSSQSQKKEERNYFQKNAEFSVGIRTRRVAELVKRELRKLPSADTLDEETLSAIAEWAVYAYGIKKDKSKNGSDQANQSKKKAKAVEPAVETEEDEGEEEKKDVMFFTSDAEIHAIAVAALGMYQKDNSCLNNRSINKDLKANVGNITPTMDIALYGRMSASDPSLSEDATSQTGYAFTTHLAKIKYDTHTACDEVDSNTGAGYMGGMEVSNGVYYEYFNINLSELVEKLGVNMGAYAAAMKVKASILTVPQGHVTACAHDSWPSLVYLTLRDDKPVNFYGAFECPVKSEAEGGFIAPSMRALKDSVEGFYESYREPVKEFYVGSADLKKFLNGEFRGEKLTVDKGIPETDVVNVIQALVKDLFKEA